MVVDIQFLQQISQKIALTSMPCDPIHPGHISCLQNINGTVKERFGFEHGKDFVSVCLVNGDDFLMKKKGYCLIPLEDRLKIIDSIKDGVDYVVPFVPSEAEDMTVIEGIRMLKPFCFLKGGDRKADETLPEWNVCREIGCEIIDRVGAEKKWSSSEYVERLRGILCKQRN